MGRLATCGRHRAYQGACRLCALGPTTNTVRLLSVEPSRQALAVLDAPKSASGNRSGSCNRPQAFLDDMGGGMTWHEP